MLSKHIFCHTFSFSCFKHQRTSIIRKNSAQVFFLPHLFSFVLFMSITWTHTQQFHPSLGTDSQTSSFFGHPVPFCTLSFAGNKVPHHADAITAGAAVSDDTGSTADGTAATSSASAVGVDVDSGVVAVFSSVLSDELPPDWWRRFSGRL